VALTGLTIAEQFRDASGTDVLFFVDNIFRFTQAGSEVSALLGRIPRRWATSRRWPPTWDAAGADHLDAERLDHERQAIYVPADDLTDPAPATSSRTSTPPPVLSRAISELGIYPAVDPLDSNSRILDPLVVGREHYETARAVQGILQRYKSLQDIIAILGMDELSEEDKVTGGPRPQDPALPVAALRRGAGLHRLARRAGAARGNHRLVQGRRDGEYDHLPEAPSTWSAASRTCRQGRAHGRGGGLTMAGRDAVRPREPRSGGLSSLQAREVQIPARTGT
jgi:hypothetical protein